MWPWEKYRCASKWRDFEAGFPESAGHAFSRATIAEIVAHPFDIVVSNKQDEREGYRMQCNAVGNIIYM